MGPFTASIHDGDAVLARTKDSVNRDVANERAHEMLLRSARCWRERENSVVKVTVLVKNAVVTAAPCRAL
jgi:hypothetical protein